MLPWCWKNQVSTVSTSPIGLGTCSTPLWTINALLHFGTYIRHNPSQLHVCSTPQQLPALSLQESTELTLDIFVLALHSILIFYSAARMSTVATERIAEDFCHCSNTIYIKQFKSFSSECHNSDLQILLDKSHSTSQKINLTPSKRSVFTFEAKADVFKIEAP